MHSAFRASHRSLSQTVCVVTSILSLAALPAFAQSRSPLPDQLLSRQLVTFEIVLGRLQLSQESFRIGAAHERIALADGGQRVRSISVSVLHGRPTLQFQDLGGDEDWKLQFKAKHQVELQFASRVDRTFKTLVYRQPAEGPIAIEVGFGSGRPTRCVEAASLWHLLLEDPDFFYTYVEPVLLRIEPTWEFRGTVKRVQELLHEQSESQPACIVSERALAKLDSKSAAERSASCHELERLGLAAKLELQGALTRSITCQQRSAIDHVLSGLQPIGNDTAMRIAVWLGGDRELRQATVASVPILR